MPISLCETFRALAFQTFDRMGRCRRVGYQPLEEALTDYIILELMERHTGDVYCCAFNKQQEGRNGADWELWLTDYRTTRWLGLRVQAKALHFDSNQFEHLHYRSRTTGEYQLAKLKRVCKAEGMVPLYCLYLHTHSYRLLPRFIPSIEYYGCSIAPLPHVESLQVVNESNFQPVMTRAFPWHRLVCYGAHRAPTLPERAWLFLQDRMGIDNTGGQDEGQPGITMGPRQQPPDYVLAILKQRANENSTDNNPNRPSRVVIIREPK